MRTDQAKAAPHPIINQCLFQSEALQSCLLPGDPNGVYFVLTSGDVSETGFGTKHCGWHTSSLSAGLSTISGVDIKYAFVGDADPNYTYNCISNYQTDLSGSLGADGMANIITHDLNESTIDPDGEEISDLCEWTFGAAYHSSSASDPYAPNDAQRHSVLDPGKLAKSWWRLLHLESEGLAMGR
jgi:hypothetical protein